MGKTMANMLYIVSLLLVFGLFGVGEVESHVTPPNNEGKPEHIQTIHLASYQPTDEQVKFVANSFDDDQNREAIKGLVNILRQSTVQEKGNNDIDEYTNEFESETVADAAYETKEEKAGEEEATGHNLTHLQHYATPHPQHHHGNHRPHHANPHGKAANGAHTAAPVQVAVTDVAPLVRAFCDMLMSNQKYLDLCGNHKAQQLIMKAPKGGEGQYKVDVLGQHYDAFNNAMLEDLKDDHPLKQSLLYVLTKICEGPLPVACQNIARHVQSQAA